MSCDDGYRYKEDIFFFTFFIFFIIIIFWFQYCDDDDDVKFSFVLFVIASLYLTTHSPTRAGGLIYMGEKNFRKILLMGYI